MNSRFFNTFNKGHVKVFVKVDTLTTDRPTTANFDALLGWVFLRHNSEIRTTDPGIGDDIGNPFQITTNSGTTACLQAIHAPGSYKGVYAPAIAKITKTPQQEYVVK